MNIVGAIFVGIIISMLLWALIKIVTTPGSMKNIFQKGDDNGSSNHTIEIVIMISVLIMLFTLLFMYFMGMK